MVVGGAGERGEGWVGVWALVPALVPIPLCLVGLPDLVKTKTELPVKFACQISNENSIGSVYPMQYLGHLYTKVLFVPYVK